MGKKDTPILVKLQNEFAHNNTSLVFAPLANAYRKLALYQKAYEVLSVGLRYHPEHILGHIVLAQCYFDEGKIELTFQTLAPWVNNYKSNVQLQELYAQVCIKKGLMEEGLETYKYLLFLFPKNNKYKSEVRKWEDSLQFKPSHIKNVENVSMNSIEHWVEETPSPQPLQPPPITPILNLALVDLYMSQKIWDKALLILEKMIQLEGVEKMEGFSDILEKKSIILFKIYEKSFHLFKEKIFQFKGTKNSSLLTA